MSKIFVVKAIVTNHGEIPRVVEEAYELGDKATKFDAWNFYHQRHSPNWHIGQ